jgi:hypothetical protein
MQEQQAWVWEREVWWSTGAGRRGALAKSDITHGRRALGLVLGVARKPLGSPRAPGLS